MRLVQGEVSPDLDSPFFSTRCKTKVSFRTNVPLQDSMDLDTLAAFECLTLAICTASCYFDHFTK